MRKHPGLCICAIDVARSSRLTQVNELVRRRVHTVDAVRERHTMSRRLIVITSVLLACAGPACAAQHAHAPPTAAPSRKIGDARAAPARGWATDTPLRTGMARIRDSVDALDQTMHGRPDPSRAGALAGRIETDVSYLITHCRLEPAADAALHGIIARLLQGAAALKRQPADPAPIAALQQALRDYARSFDDPGFKARPTTSAAAGH